MTGRKPAYPAHAPDMREGEDEDEDHQPLVRPALGKRKGVTHLLMTETLYRWFLQDYIQLHQCGKEKDLQRGKTQLPYWNKKCQGTCASEQRVPRICEKKQKVKLYATSSAICVKSATCGTFHLEHYHMSTAQCKKRTTHLDTPGIFFDVYQHVEDKPFLQFHKTETGKISRERTSGSRIWRPHLLRPWIGKDWRQNTRISDRFRWCHITFDKLIGSHY